MATQRKKFIEAEPIYQPREIPTLKRNPLSYHVVIRPRPAPTKLGSGILASATRTRKAQAAVCTIGEVVKIGALAWKSGTPEMDPLKDPESQSIKVGDWVVYRQHSGQKLRLKQEVSSSEDEAEDKHLLILADTDVLMPFASREESELFTDWV